MSTAVSLLGMHKVSTVLCQEENKYHVTFFCLWNTFNLPKDYHLDEARVVGGEACEF
jgi:hypothetical protein